MSDVYPRLRRNLRIAHRRGNGHEEVIVEDPVSSRFYRLGAVEYAFASRLVEGAEAAVTAANALYPTAQLTPADGKRIAAWLAHEGLLEGIDDAAAAAPARTLPRWLNPLIIRLPLVNPDAWLGRHQGHMRVFMSRPFAVCWCLAVLSAMVLAGHEWSRLVTATSGVLYQGNWLALLMVWLTAKIAHETLHGVTCKHFGGEVFEAGLIFVLFLPVGYVDATSSWRFNRRYQRVFVALAGMYIELFLAAIALWVWALAPAGILRDIAFNTVIVAGFTTLLFNANPLMRFDGYYALSDLLDIPNLYGRGQRYVSYLLRRHLLGQPVSSELGRAPRDVFVRCYGLATWLWRGMVIVTLVIAAAHLFHGAGLILAVLAVVGIVLGWLARGRVIWASLDGAARRAAVLRLCASAGVMAVLVHWITWPEHITAPAWVDYRGAEIVRSPGDGFVSALSVNAGQSVAAGDVLAHLDNPDLRLASELTTIELEQASLRERARRSAGEMAAAADEHATVIRLRQRLDGQRAQLAELQVTASRAGVVDAVDPASLRGRYLHAGDELFRILDPDAKRIRVALSERDAARLRTRLAEVRFPHREPLRIALSESSPRASHQLTNRQLAVVHGGPLPVRITEDTDATARRYELLEARVEWTGALPSDAAEQLRNGELGHARLQGPRLSAFTRLWDSTAHWIRHLVERGDDPSRS